VVVFTVFIAAGLEDVHTFEVEEGSKGIITVTLPYTTAVAIDDSFEIKTDGTTWIKGKVQRIKIRRVGMTNTKILTCYGKTHTLYEKYCLDFGFHQYFNKDVGWIANDLVDHYFGGTLTSVNINVATGVVLTHFECDGRSIGEALEVLASRGDCNFYVDNDDDVHFFIRPGAASGLTAEDLGELKIVDESGRKFVKVIVRGRHRAIQASAGAGFPEFFYQDDRIISTTEAGEVATAMVAELGATRQQIVAREDSFMETRAGKTIILNVPADGFNDQVIEIQKIRWVCKQPNINRTYFTLGSKEPTIDSVLAKIARGVTWLPDVQIQRGAAFPTDPADDQAFTLTGDVVVPAVYYGAAEGIFYTWDAINTVWKRPPYNLGRKAGPPAVGGEVTEDVYYDTTDKITYSWTGAAWVNMILGAGAIDLGIHIIEGLTLTDNDPGAGSIAWTEFTVSYAGSVYTVAAGNTANAYAWWDKSVSEVALQTVNVKPAITNEDYFIAMNVLGTAYASQNQNFLYGDAIVDDSVTSIQIAPLTITANEIENLTITRNEIANNTIRAGQIDALTITRAEIANNTIRAGQIDALTITDNEIDNLTITGGKIAIGTITGNKIDDLTIEAINMKINSVTEAKIIAQAVSIGKLATNIATEAFSPLFTTFEEYSRVTIAGAREVEGAIVYEREELAETYMRFKLKKAFGSVKATANQMTLDVYAYSGADTSGIFDLSTLFDRQQHGAGGSAWNLILDFTAGLGYKSGNQYQNRAERVGGGAATVSMFANTASIDITDYTKVHVTIGQQVNTSTTELRLETDAANYYSMADVDLSVAYHVRTVVIDDMDVVGTPDPEDINQIRLVPTLPDNPDNMYMGAVYFTKCLVDIYEFDSDVYVDWDAGALDLEMVTGEDIHVAYYLVQAGYHGAEQTIYLNYPASTIYNVGYMEAVT